MKGFHTMRNGEALRLKSVPDLPYGEFHREILSMADRDECHPCAYFALPEKGGFRLYCVMADDRTGMLLVSSSAVRGKTAIPSLSAIWGAFHPFEREIHETWGIEFTDHPWLKGLRFPPPAGPEDMDAYPFFDIHGQDLHQVGVGPIHAGVIEPGHFRFICNGERVLHLEIQLGYQHRGVEKLFLTKKSLMERVILAESIAGDTTAGHGTAFANLYESLAGFTPDNHLSFTRTLALELERMAVHTGDLAAIAGDVAYQLGNGVFGRLRTPIINFNQSWGGNRLGRGIIRPGRTNHPFTGELGKSLFDILHDYEKDYVEMSDMLFRLPGAVARFQNTGTVTREDTVSMGAVGMAARSAGLVRDIRKTHPHDLYLNMKYEPKVLVTGDVMARARLRDLEIRQSMDMVRNLIAAIPSPAKGTDLGDKKLKGESLVVSLTEGWRGEICHVAVTDRGGNIAAYKIYDPSIHNWFALAMAVRTQEISDFPLCNKSFNLSYCGHDL